MTPETLAAMAIAWLGGKAVETGGRLAAAGYQYAEQKLFDWLKARFDTADDAGALKRLEDKPESPAVRSRLTAEVLEAMENDTPGRGVGSTAERGKRFNHQHKSNGHHNGRRQFDSANRRSRQQNRLGD